MNSFKNKIAIVTGGSRGIGAAIARELGAHGATVVINYNHSHEHADKVVEEITAMGSTAIAFQADIAESEATRKLVEETIRQFGKVDILVNNAGITRDRSFRKMSE